MQEGKFYKFETSDIYVRVTNKKGKFGFVDKNGKIVIKPKYANVGNFSEDLACVRKNNYYGYINRLGKLVIPMEYDFNSPVKGGVIINAKSGLYGIMDNQGKIIVPFTYDKIFEVKDGIYKLDKGERTSFCDKNGLMFTDVREVIELKYSSDIEALESKTKNKLKVAQSEEEVNKILNGLKYGLEVLKQKRDEELFVANAEVLVDEAERKQKREEFMRLLRTREDGIQKAEEIMSDFKNKNKEERQM